jgi:hypothetical protein
MESKARTSGRHAPAVGIREVAGDQQAMLLAAFFENSSARGASLIGIEASETVDLGRRNLKRTVHQIPVKRPLSLKASSRRTQ